MEQPRPKRTSASIDGQVLWQLQPVIGERLPASHVRHDQLSHALRDLSRLGKRVFDLIAALFLLVFSLPLMAMVGVLVAMDGGSVFYKGLRIGRHGAPFKCLKFRTMISDAECCLEEYLSYHPDALEQWNREQKLATDPRITSVGRFLRSSSLDELPQLINVIKGEMSLVGPRPITRPELERYGPAASLYKSVRPGMTGLWQISGRNEVSYATRVA